MTLPIPHSIGRGPDFTGLRLSAKTIQALEFMAHEALSLADAADRAGVRRDNLKRAFDLPAVRERFNEIVAWIRNSEGGAAYLRMVQLAKTADSEHVRLEANKWLAGVDGLAPVKRVEGRFSHRHGFEGFDFAQALDAEWTEAE